MIKEHHKKVQIMENFSMLSIQLYSQSRNKLIQKKITPGINIEFSNRLNKMLLKFLRFLHKKLKKMLIILFEKKIKNNPKFPIQLYHFLPTPFKEFLIIFGHHLQEVIKNQFQRLKRNNLKKLFVTIFKNQHLS